MEFLKRADHKSLYLISLILMLVASFTSLGFLHPDEQYYVVDFAAFKAGILKNLNTWEYKEQIRPWLLPTIFSPFLTAFSFLGFSPFSMAVGLKLLSSLFAWIGFVLFTSSIKRAFKGSLSHNLFIYFLMLSFFTIFMSVRTNSENWSTAMFLIGVSFILRDRMSILELLFGGLCFGLSFSLRHQVGLMVFTFGMWMLFYTKVGLRSWLSNFVPGILLGVFVGFLCDSWGYGEWVFTPWNYLHQNIVLDKISQFGTDPFYKYFVWTFTKLTPVWGLPLILSFFAFCISKPKHWLTWTCVPFLILHLCIGHKELRFLYPLAPLVLTMLAILVDDMDGFRNGLSKWLYRFIVYVNAAAIIVILIKPAYTPLKFYEFLWNEYPSGKIIQTIQDEQGRSPVLEMPFYKRESLVLAPNKNWEILFAKSRENGLAIFTTKYSEYLKIKKTPGCEISFISYPEWIFEYNYFNWVSRSSIWMLSNCR